MSRARNSVYTREPHRKILGLLQGLTLLLALAVFSGCTKQNEPQAELIEPMTGDSFGLEGTAALPLTNAEWSSGEHLLVASDRLRLRSSAEFKDQNIIEVLDKNDEVIVLQTADKNSEFILVSIPSIQKKGYVGRAYLSKLAAAPTGEQQASQYFLIQNIATEQTRLYRKCSPTSDNCQHELILETENVIGDNTEDTRTWLGSFKITHWFKFYEDSDGRYPAWYDPRYLNPPTATDPLAWWFARSFLPKTAGPNAEIRGAFGWFAAYLAPDVSAQWIHGTFGWGSQKKLPLQNTRSHGCTRFDNESVAYLRHMLRLGTPVLRIYAKEEKEESGSSNSNLNSNPKSQWQYILTKDDAQSDQNEDIDRDHILSLGIPQKRWLEQGIYDINASSQARNGNPYKITEKEFSGKFLVSEGRVTADYRHPKSLAWGGYRDKLIPNEMIKQNYKKQIESLR